MAHSRSRHPRRTLPARGVGRAAGAQRRGRLQAALRGCHEGSLPRAPNREALRAMAPEAIDTALSSFSMRRQGAALSSAERRAVAAFLSGRPAGSYRAPLEMIGKDAYCAAGTAPRDPLAGRGVERMGHRSAEFAIADGCRGRSDRGRYPQAQIEVGVRHSWCVRLGIAGHRRRQPRVRRQPQRRGVCARYEDRLPGVGVRGRCRRALDAGRRSRSRRQQHALLRRRARAGLCAGRRHRRSGDGR